MWESNKMEGQILTKINYRRDNRLKQVEMNLINQKNHIWINISFQILRSPVLRIYKIYILNLMQVNQILVKLIRTQTSLIKQIILLTQVK